METTISASDCQDLMHLVPIDCKPNLRICDCCYEPGLMDDEWDAFPWHYLRECRVCGFRWGSLHCPHDGTQRRCPECHVRPQSVDENCTPQEMLEAMAKVDEFDARWNAGGR